MNDIIVISYDDEILGQYFKKCRNDLENFIQLHSELSPDIHCMHNNCNQTNVLDQIKSLDDNYCVIVYAHGSEESIKDQHGSILIHKDDASNFHNAVFYSTACNNAESLGIEVIRYGCKLFFGYKKVSYGIEDGSYPIYDTFFVESDNFAIKEILNGCNNGKELYDKTYDFIYSCCLKLEEIDDALVPFLFHNLESFKIIEYPNKEYY